MIEMTAALPSTYTDAVLAGLLAAYSQTDQYAWSTTIAAGGKTIVVNYCSRGDLDVTQILPTLQAKIAAGQNELDPNGNTNVLISAALVYSAARGLTFFTMLIAFAMFLF